MSKIRINELARELEVKPNVILETLAELGIADKKTHSSSLDDDVALQVRQRVTGESGEGSAPMAAGHGASGHVASRREETAEESAPASEPFRAQPSVKPSALKVESAAAEAVIKEAPAKSEEVPAAPVRLAPP